MKLIILMIAALPAFGLSNCVTLHEAARLASSQRPVMIHRWFAEGEIAGYPRPFIGGVAPSAWQADVKARWDDGTVRLAYISWRQDLSANGSVTACFENSTNRSSAGDDSATNAAALSQAQMLAFDTGSGAGSWNGIIEATLNSIRYSANAKTMLTDGNWSYWLRGPVVTWAIAEDRTSALSYDFGWQYSGGAWGAPSSATYKSLHPIFCLQFWPDPDGAGSLTAWPGVEVDAILWNASITRLQRIPLDSLLVNTGDGTVTSYSVSNANLYARRTWHTVVWSGTAPTDVVVDHNLKYMIHSWALPTLDYEASMAPTVADADLSAYASSLGTDLPEFPVTSTSKAANWAKYVATTGARGDIALIPRWYLRYLFAMGNSSYSVAQRLDIWKKLVIGNAEAATSYPVHYLETDSSGRTAGFGRPIEITYRPTLTIRSNYITGNEDAGGVDAPVYACSSAPCDARAANIDTADYYGKWKPDTAHQPSFFAMPFLLTGRPFYLWEQQFVAAWNIAAATAGRSGIQAAPACTDAGLNSYGRWDSWGIAYPSANWRAHVWTVRDFFLAAALSADGTSEKAYFVNLLKNNDEVLEGYYNIRDGLYPPPDPYCTGYNQATTTSKWCSGLMSQRFFGNNPLRIPSRGEKQAASGLQYGSTVCAGIGFAFQFGYAANVYPWIAGSRAILHNGQPVFSTAKREIGKFMAEWTLHPDSNQFLQTQGVPTMTVLGSSITYPQSWAEFKSITESTTPLFATITSTDTVIKGNTTTNSGFPQTNLGAIKIDDEWILVCSFGYGTPTTFYACANGRGAWGTTAAAHTVGTTITFYPLFRSYEFQGGYEWIQRAARASLADVASGSYTNRRAFEWFNSNTTGLDYMNNPANSMQSPQWCFRPRDEIVNVRATAGSGMLRLRWVAPSGEPCRVYAGPLPPGSDDGGDPLAAASSREQSFTAAGVGPGLVYYRIGCGTAWRRGAATVD